jgi:large subunit ribosomal protein L7e
LIKRAQQYAADYQKATQDELAVRRAAKVSGQIHVPAQPKVAFVIRIRGINKLDPRSVRILRLLRLRQLHNGAFIRINKASTNLIRKVEPYVTFGYNYIYVDILPEKPSRSSSLSEDSGKSTTKEFP